MSRTRIRNRRLWDRESTYIKQLYRQRYRAKSKQAIREGRFDLMPIEKGTEGWLTW